MPFKTSLVMLLPIFNYYLIIIIIVIVIIIIIIIIIITIVFLETTNLNNFGFHS